MARWKCDLCETIHIHTEPTGRFKTLCCDKEVVICCGNNLIAHAVAVEHEQEHVQQFLKEQEQPKEVEDG